MRERMLVVLLAVAASLVVVGVAHFSTGAAFVASGLLLAGLAWLVLGEVGE